MNIRINEPTEDVKVSSKGRSVTIIYKNGEKRVFSFDNVLKCLVDAERAKNEYLLQLWYFLSTYTDLPDEKVKETLRTVRERLTKSLQI
jgi:hypothetical protein